MKIDIFQPQAVHELGSRGNQEDSIYPHIGTATPQDRVFIVCDGMGGHEHGEVASGVFSSALAEYFKSHDLSRDVLSDATLADALAFAYAKLDDADDGSFKKMGTTLTMLCLHRGGVTAAHIGDSRIYHIRPDVGLLYVSRDHSLVYDLYQSGEITFDEIKTSSRKNVITRAVQPGEDNRVKPDIIHITDIRNGDYFVLCSDGILERMEDEDLLQLLSAGEKDTTVHQKIIDLTSDNNDNHSAYLIHVKDVVFEDSDNNNFVNEEKTAKCNALNIKRDNQNLNNDDIRVISQAEPQSSPLRGHCPHKTRSMTWLLALLVALLVAGVVVAVRMLNHSEKQTEMTNEVKQIAPIQVVPRKERTVKPTSAERKNRIANPDEQKSGKGTKGNDAAARHYDTPAGHGNEQITTTPSSEISNNPDSEAGTSTSSENENI